MKVKIFDVGHGGCALIEHPNGLLSMVDCGHNEATGFRPSRYLQEQLGTTGSGLLYRLVITHADDDHVSDLQSLYEKFPPTILVRNRSVSSADIIRIKTKETPLSRLLQQSPGITTFLKMHEHYTGPVYEVDEGGVDVRHFHVPANQLEEPTTDDLSLVTFAFWGNHGIFLPGDITARSMLKLMENQTFLDCLALVDVFVAPHHGRTSPECCSPGEVFKYCKPSVIVISDKLIEHETQEGSANYYGQYATGVSVPNGKYLAPSVRKVITTRNDGALEITFGGVKGSLAITTKVKSAPSLAGLFPSLSRF